MSTPRPKYVAVTDFGRGQDRFLAGQPVTPGPALLTILNLPEEEQAKFIKRAKGGSSAEPDFGPVALPTPPTDPAQPEE